MEKQQTNVTFNGAVYANQAGESLLTANMAIPSLDVPPPASAQQQNYFPASICYPKQEMMD